MNEKREEYFRCAGCAVVFFCAVTVIMGALPWLVYGVIDNLSYHRYVGTVIAISELVPSNITVDGRVINNAEAAYEYRLDSGEVRRDTFRVYDWDADGIPDEYAVGDEYILYTHDGYSGDMSESWARGNMTDNILYPLIFIIPAVIAAAAGGAKTKGLSLIWYVYPKSVVFSCIMSLLSAWEAVYNLFIFEADGFLSGLAEAFAQLGAIAFCFLAVIAEIIVWATAIHREKKRINSLDTDRVTASFGTEGGGAYE